MWQLHSENVDNIYSSDVTPKFYISDGMQPSLEKKPSLSGLEINKHIVPLYLKSYQLKVQQTFSRIEGVIHTFSVPLKIGVGGH